MSGGTDSYLLQAELEDAPLRLRERVEVRLLHEAPHEVEGGAGSVQGATPPLGLHLGTGVKKTALDRDIKENAY